MITESYRNRIRELAGLLNEEQVLLVENSVEKLTGLGFSKEIADYLLYLNKKRSIVIGDLLTKEFAKSKGITQGHIKNILPSLDPQELLLYLKSKENEINYFLEWLKDASQKNQQLDIKSIETWDEALSVAHEWERAAAEENEFNVDNIKDESGEIVKTYPNAEVDEFKFTYTPDSKVESELLGKVKGLYWINLKTNESPDEASVMHHCGKDLTATTLFSLRHNFKTRFVTVAYDENTKYIKQVKAKWNQRPLDIYMVYVYDFLKDLLKKGKLNGFRWSYSPHGDDLNQDDIKKIFEDKYPEYVFNILISALDNTMNTKLPFTIEQAKEIMGDVLYKRYVYTLLGKVLENPSYNKIPISQDEVKRVIGEDGHKKFVSALINKMIEGGNIFSLSNVVQRLQSNYGIEITQGNLKDYVGVEKYKEYIRALLNRAIENPVVNALGVSKEEIVAELGLDAYVEYINAVIGKVLESPETRRLPISKEEIREAIGEEKYQKFLADIIKGMLRGENIMGLNGVMSTLDRNYVLSLTANEIKDVVGDIEFKRYVTKLYEKSYEDPIENKIDIDKNIIIDELGLEKYIRYVNRILDVSAEDPANKKLKFSKEEIIDTVGQAKYNEFIKKVVLGFVNDKSFRGESKLIEKLQQNFDIEMDSKKIREAVGAQLWFNFLKRSKFQGGRTGFLSR